MPDRTPRPVVLPIDEVGSDDALLSGIGYSPMQEVLNR